MLHSIQVMGNTLAEDGRSWRIMAGYGCLACDGNGHMVTMEHKAGIEWVVGFRLGSGCGCGSGHGFGPGY